MGQKIHPNGFRVGVIKGWESRWLDPKNVAANIEEDYKIRKFLEKTLRYRGLSRIEIERAQRVHIIINTSKPGMVIGKKGAGIDALRNDLAKLTGKQIKVSVVEVKQPELDAVLVGQSVAEALEKRIAFRRAMKQAASRSIKSGALGVKIQLSGRLGGTEIARSERTFQGKVPLHTLRADVDYAIVEALTTAGKIGIKVWVYRGEVLPQSRAQQEQ